MGPVRQRRTQAHPAHMNRPPAETAPATGVLSLLWVLWLALLTAGLGGRLDSSGWLSAHETALKAASSAVLGIAAWYAASRLTPAALRAPMRCIAVGMTLGMLGDASPLLGDRWPDPQRTLGNMLLFGVGHVAYITASWHWRRQLPRPCTWSWWAAVITAIGLAIVTWYFAAATGTQCVGLRGPALGYTLLLATTVGVMGGLALQDRRFLPLALGAALFFVSDALLAVWIFHSAVYRPFDLVWLSYGLGQMLIVYGAICAQATTIRGALHISRGAI